MDAFLTILGQVALLFAFSAVGFALARLKVIDARQVSILSRLLVHFFLPCNVLKTFATQFRPAYLGENYVLLLVALGAIAVIAPLSYFLSKLFSKESYERAVFEYSLAIPNAGYMGYPLAEALLGASGLLSVMVFAIPISFFINSYGYARLTKSRLTAKKMLNTVTVAMFIGMIIGLSGIELPPLPLSFLSSASGSMGPISMLIAGISISEFGLRPLVRELRAYPLAAARLLIAPLAVGGVAYLLCGRGIASIAALYFAMPCGLNTIVFAKAVDEPCRLGASLVFVSTVLSLLTIPLVLFLFGIG